MSEFIESCKNEHKMDSQRFFVVLTHLDLAKAEKEKEEGLDQVIKDLRAVLGDSWDKSLFCVTNPQSIMHAINLCIYSEDLEKLEGKLLRFMGQSLREELVDIFLKLKIANNEVTHAVVEYNCKLKLPLCERKQKVIELERIKERFKVQGRINYEK